MNNQLFEDFAKVSSKEWKNLIQFDLKGADYNQTLLWESLEGIKVRPFYQGDIDNNPLAIKTKTTEFSILQRIYVFDVQKSIEKTLDVLKKGAESIYFTIDNLELNAKELLAKLPKQITYFFTFTFLDQGYLQDLATWAKDNDFKVNLLVCPIDQLENQGNWFVNLDSDFARVKTLLENNSNIHIGIDTGIYQNAGANMVQQIAYTLAKVSEYLNRIPSSNNTIYIQNSTGSNYFFEIAKLRALRLVLDLVIQAFNTQINYKIISLPSKRNKTLYDYNVNMLRTTTESMSAILGGADFVSNLPYDAIYHKENEFSDRIARNQLLILKQESYFNAVNNPTEGAYYIEYLTIQLAEKALEVFKLIEKADGLITQLIQGVIQRKISQSAQKEQDLFDQGKEVLLGSNKYPNAQDHMSDDLELYPFIKHNPRKTLIIPILAKRLAQEYEKQRLEKEKLNND
ncbi:methylmalonyl-CoA mutase subunit beta [Myroides sp. LJL119]